MKNRITTKPGRDPRFPQLRGEPMICGDRLTDADRRYGVPAPKGALVLGEDGVGVLIGGSEDVAVIPYPDGRESAINWGEVYVQASGPAPHPCFGNSKLT